MSNGSERVPEYQPTKWVVRKIRWHRISCPWMTFRSHPYHQLERHRTFENAIHHINTHTYHTEPTA